MTFEEVEKFVRLAKEQGLSAFSLDDLSFSFFPQQMAVVEPPQEDILVEGVVEMSVKGSDGLTADEQQALYGRVIDAR